MGLEEIWTRRFALGKSKEARCDAQEELETRQGRRQAWAQDGGKAREAEKSEVQGSAQEQREETRKKQRQAVETTKIDVIDEAAPGVISVKEYDSVRTATSVAPGIEPERGEGVGPAGAS